MHYFREMILLFYIVSIAMGVAGLTCCVLPMLPNLRKKTEHGKHMALFIGGLLAICFYDMIIYYGNYVLGIFSNLEVMRIGNCIIAGTMCLWILLQQRIIPREALKFLDRVMLRYLPLYSIVWLVLTIVLSLKQFYSLKWLLLSSDIILILGFLSVCVAHIIYAAVAGEKTDFYYLILITGMLLWNYISYFWSETSVYWGNSGFIRAPMDLTIIIWMAINAVNLVYSYRKIIRPAFETEAGLPQEPPGSAEPAAQVQPPVIRDRIEEVREQYQLTPREKEVVELIYRGRTNREIAEMLFLSESTVKTHVYNIFRKMGVKNRVGIHCIINEETMEQMETHDHEE